MSHPLDRFCYCPVCGSPRWNEHNEKSKLCADCGFTYYANPSAATAAFILRPSTLKSQTSNLKPQTPSPSMELLVVRRAKEPARGTFDLPGGFVDMDETAEQGILREVHEETGLRLPAVRYLFSIPNLYMYSGMEIHTLDLFFTAQVDAQADACAGDDAEDCQWVPVDNLRPEDFGLKSIRQAVQRFKTSYPCGRGRGEGWRRW